MRAVQRRIAGYGHDTVLLRPQGWLAQFGPEHLNLLDRCGFEALYEHQVDRGKPGSERHRVRRGVGGLAQQRPALAAHYQHFLGAGLAMTKTVLAGLVQIQAVMSVLDGGNAQAGRPQLR